MSEIKMLLTNPCTRIQYVTNLFRKESKIGLSTIAHLTGHDTTAHEQDKPRQSREVFEKLSEDSKNRSPRD